MRVPSHQNGQSYKTTRGLSVSDLYERIIGYEKLAAVYGHWPSFHDSEIVSIRLDRDAGQPLTGALLTVWWHVFRIEVAPDHPQRDDRLVSIVFRKIEDLHLTDFNHQNAIIDFTLSCRYSSRLRRDTYAIQFKQGFGVDCSFECGEMEILSVEPFTPPEWKRASHKH